MKKTLIIGLLMASCLLAGCDSSSSATSTSSTDTEPVDSSSTSGEVVGVFNNSLGGWTYISDSPEYLDAEYYSGGGLKFNFINKGVASPTFTASKRIKFAINIGSLVNKGRTGGDSHVFTVYALDSADAIIATDYIDTSGVGYNNTVTFDAEGVVKVKTIMTGYYQQNTVELSGATITYYYQAV